VTPRAKPAPKEKPKTKWEKFREAKGLPARKKRSRLVFDKITQDWVPRWGPNSNAKIAKKHEWLLEDKPEGGPDPFTIKRQEKQLQLEKENLKRMKNELHAIKATHGKSSLKKGVNEVLASSNQQKAFNGGASKRALNEEHSDIKKRERKALDKSLSLAQLSTASMGKFDKKVSKHEPEAPNSIKIQKKKSNADLARL
jgi:regulator of ribosome biosynthesis